MRKRILNQLALEFWLPLPLIAFGFWFGLSWLNHYVLGQSYVPQEPLSTEASREITISFSLTVTSIDAEVDRDLGITEVTVQTIGSSLQELEFEYPFVEFEEIEAAIANELNLSPDTIRTIIRYRIYE